MDPPARETRPPVGRIALDREIHLAHPCHGVQEILEAEADSASLVGSLRELYSHRPGDLREAEKTAPQAEPRGHFGRAPWRQRRSEEHTSELQSPCNIVCR